MSSNNLLNTRNLIVILGAIALFSLIFLAKLIVVTGIPFYFFLIILGGILLVFLESKKIFVINIQEFFIIIFMFWLLIPISNAYNVMSSILQYYYFAISFLLFFLIKRFCFNEKDWVFISKALLLGGCITSILMILNFDSIFEGDRVNINGINANYLAYSLVTLLPVLYIFLNNRRKNKIYYCFLLLFSAAIFLTGSRGALISLIIFYVFLSFKKPLFGLAIFLIIISCFTIFLGFYDSLPQYWKTRFDFQSFASNDVDWSSGREATWTTAWRIFEDHYIFGIGPNNFGEIGGFGINVHNVFLSLLVETGIFGFILYFMAFFSILFFITKKNILLGVIVLLIEIPIFFTGVWESSPVLWVVLSLLMAYVTLFDVKNSKYQSIKW